MASYTDLCDCPLAVTLSKPTVLVKAYYDYRRYAVSIKTKDAPPFLQERDVLIAGKVVVVIPIDLVRQQIVLIRQFRLPAHIANGLGDMVEFVAGRVEPNETLVDAARRECREEIGVAPEKTVQLLRYLTTPGSSDEEVTISVPSTHRQSAMAREQRPTGSTFRSCERPSKMQSAHSTDTLCAAAL
jgi:ADP-ribose pyrophosphatase